MIEINENNFENEVLKSDKTILVDFNAEWCGPCKMLHPILEELSNERSDFKIVSINVDDNMNLAKEYGILSIPCLVVIKNGKEVKRLVGLRSKDDIISMMEE